MNTLFYFLMVVTLAVCGCTQAPPATVANPAEPAASESAAGLSVELAIKAGVKLDTAAPGTLRETVSLYGSIQADPERVRKIAARYPGIVRAVLHDVGDHVVAGDKLATIESNDSLQLYSVTTPLTGVITARHTNVGEVASDTALYEVADYSRVRAELSVFPRDRSRLRVNQLVVINATDGTASTEGKLIYVAPAGTGNSQSIVARVSLNNNEGQWTTGQFVTGDVVISESRAPIVITPAAIQQVKGDSVVYVQNGKMLELRRVELGRRATNAVEIKSGLSAGEMYVAQNSYLVKADLLKNEAEEE